MTSSSTIQSPLVRLLRETFGGHTFPEACSVSLALAENQDDYGDLIAVVDKIDQRETLKSRIAKTHPLHRPHIPEHDADFWNVWTEPKALAWAATVGGYDRPQFTDDVRKPDIWAAPNTWIEAKTVRRSPQEDRVINEMADKGIAMRGPKIMVELPQQVLAKFRSHHDKAISQRDAQGGGHLVVYFAVKFDWPVNQRTAELSVENWAQTASLRSGARIVVSNYENWSTPFVDVFFSPS